VGVDDDSQRPPRRAGLTDRARAGVGAFIGVLYAIGTSLRGEVLPGIIGGVLAGVLCFLVLRAYERQRGGR
jgi:hypothetical protein